MHQPDPPPTSLSARRSAGLAHPTMKGQLERQLVVQLLGPTLGQLGISDAITVSGPGHRTWLAEPGGFAFCNAGCGHALTFSPSANEGKDTPTEQIAIGPHKSR